MANRARPGQPLMRYAPACRFWNHLQDCAADLRSMDRCYIPQDWLELHGVRTDDIARTRSEPGLARHL